MARPEHLDDIELDSIEFGTIELNKISTDPALLKGYTTFIEAITESAGAEVETGYGGTVHFHRKPTLAEQLQQLETAQNAWDASKQHYEQLAEVGELEYTFQRSLAEKYATDEGLPWPPEHEPIAPFDAVIRDIDSVTAQS